MADLSILTLIKKYNFFNAEKNKPKIVLHVNQSPPPPKGNSRIGHLHGLRLDLTHEFSVYCSGKNCGSGDVPKKRGKKKRGIFFNFLAGVPPLWACENKIIYETKRNSILYVMQKESMSYLIPIFFMMK